MVSGFFLSVGFFLEIGRLRRYLGRFRKNDFGDVNFGLRCAWVEEVLGGFVGGEVLF